MKILQLNLYKEYFEAILNGTKRTEYRECTSYWKKRIEGRDYTHIRFRNGYKKIAPVMLIEYKGYNIEQDFNNSDAMNIVYRYALPIGKIISLENCDSMISPKFLFNMKYNSIGDR